MATENLLPTGSGTYNAGTYWNLVDDPVGSPDDATTRFNALVLTTINIQNLSRTDIAISKVTVFTRTLSDSTSQIVYGGVYTYGTVYKTTGYNNTTWGNHTYDFVNNPYTGVAWTPAEVNAVELVMSSSGATDKQYPWMTQAYLTVTYTVILPSVGGASCLLI